MSVYAEVLWEELNKVLCLLDMEQIEHDSEIIAKWLVIALNEDRNECKVIIQALSRSVYRCFDFEEDPVKFELSQPEHKAIIKGIEQILGYLVLSMVNPQDARNLENWLGGDDLTGMYFELHVRTLGGVELFISYQQQRRADITLDSAGRKITGKHLIFVKTAPFQWQDRAKLQETQLVVWNTIYDEERTVPLNIDDIAQLEADLITARKRYKDPASYCIVIEFNDGGDASYIEECSTFLSRLRIPMIRYKVDGGKPAFYGQEQNVMSAIKQFLIDFDKCKYS